MIRHDFKLPVLPLGGVFLLVLLVGGGCEVKQDRLTCLGEGIKVGAILPLTGGLAAYGPAMGDAVDLAADEINAAGGVLGQQVIICHRDSGTDADRSGLVAQQLVDDGVVALIGAGGSGMSTAVLAVAGPAQVPQISPLSTAPTFSSEAHGTFFRTVPSDTLQGVALAQVAVTEGALKAAVIYVEGPYGEGLAAVFESEFATDATHEVTASVEYLEGMSDYSDVVAEAFADSPDTLVLIAYPDAGVTIVDNLVAAAIVPVHVVVAEALREQAFVDTAGASNVEGWVGTFPAVATGPAYDLFEAAFLAAYGAAHTSYTEASYDAMYLLALAIEQAGTTDSAGIITSLSTVSASPGMPVGPGEWAAGLAAIAGGNDVNYDGASGSVDFDANGDVMGSYEVWRIRSGAIVVEDLIAP